MKLEDLKRFKETMQYQQEELIVVPNEKFVKFKDGTFNVVIADEFTFNKDLIVFKNNGKNVCMFPIDEIERVI